MAGSNSSVQHLVSNEILPQERAIAAHHHALFLFFCDKLTEKYLSEAEELVRSSTSALGIRNLNALRGFWLLENQNWEPAKRSLQDAVALAHRVGKRDRRSEIRLALAKYRLGKLSDPRRSAEAFLLNLEGSCHRALADLWFAIGDAEQARIHAVAAYKWAWSDGEPYIHRYELTKARALLEQLRVEIPLASPFDTAKIEHLTWEKDVSKKIELLQVASELKKANEKGLERPEVVSKNIKTDLRLRL